LNRRKSFREHKKRGPKRIPKKKRGENFREKNTEKTYAGRRESLKKLRAVTDLRKGVIKDAKGQRSAWKNPGEAEHWNSAG